MSQARNRKLNNIPVNVILSYSNYRNDLQKKMQEASELSSVDEVLEYVREFKDQNGNIDQQSQFFILANHQETIKKYPFLHEHVCSEGMDIFGSTSWDTIKRGIEHENDMLCLASPIFLILSAATLLFTTTGLTYGNKILKGDISIESTGVTFGSAILGGLAFFGAKSYTNECIQRHKESIALNDLCASLQLRK